MQFVPFWRAKNGKPIAAGEFTGTSAAGRAFNHSKFLESFIEKDLMPRWKENWTEDEVEKLKALAGSMPLTLIAKELNRTRGAVLAKATEETLAIIVRPGSGRA